MAVDRELGAGSWSYFGDARAISHGGDTFTGWISTTGNVWVARYTSDGKLTKRVIFKGLGRDDHNNPSLVFRHDGHIMVFFSPHSGHHLPPPGIPKAMHYMVSLNPYSINGFGKVHAVDTNVPGGLGDVVRGDDGEHDEVGDQAGAAEQDRDGEADADEQGVDAEVGGEAAGDAADLLVGGGAGEGSGGGGRVHG